MLRGTAHDLVQWILELEQETAVLRQEVEKLKKELSERPAKRKPKV